MKPPVAIVADTINTYVDGINAGQRRGLSAIELAHLILDALELDHTLPVIPTQAVW